MPDNPAPSRREENPYGAEDTADRQQPGRPRWPRAWWLSPVCVGLGLICLFVAWRIHWITPYHFAYDPEPPPNSTLKLWAATRILTVIGLGFILLAGIALAFQAAIAWGSNVGVKLKRAPNKSPPATH